MIEVITGTMWGGKTSALIGTLESLRSQGFSDQVAVFRPGNDTRETSNILKSHNGMVFEGATRFEDPKAIFDAWVSGKNILVIDEVHFANGDTVKLLLDMRDKAKIIIAGLQEDSMGRPFETVETLSRYASRLVILRGRCAICGGVAVRNYRLSDDEDRLSPGGEDKYSPRCDEHWEPR